MFQVFYAIAICVRIISIENSVPIGIWIRGIWISTVYFPVTINICVFRGGVFCIR